MQYDCFTCNDLPNCNWNNNLCSNTTDKQSSSVCPSHLVVEPNNRYELTIPTEGLWIRINNLNDSCSDLSLESRFTFPILFNLQTVPYFLRNSTTPIVLPPKLSINADEQNWYLGPMFFQLTHNMSTAIIGEFRLQQVKNLNYCNNGQDLEIVLFVVMSLFIVLLIGTILYVAYKYHRMRLLHQPAIAEEEVVNITRYALNVSTSKVVQKQDKAIEVDESNFKLPLSFTPYGGTHSLNFIIKRPTQSTKLHDQYAFGRALWIDPRLTQKYAIFKQ